MPDVFAGVWHDPETATVVLGVATDASVVRQRLQAAFDDSCGVEVAEVRYSLDDLIGLQARIDADADDLREVGVEITGTGIRPDNNVVVVSVRNLSDSVAAQLHSRYGDLVRLEQRDYPVLAPGREAEGHDDRACGHH